MKKTLIVCSVLMAALAVHAEVCFTATDKTPSTVPREICLTAIHVNEAAGSLGLLLNCRAVPNKPAAVTQFVRHNEDRARFVMQTELLKTWETGCFLGEAATLILSGITDVHATPEVDDSSLAMTVIYRAGQDTCHNPAYETKIGYAVSRTR